MTRRIVYLLLFMLGVLNLVYATSPDTPPPAPIQYAPADEATDQSLTPTLIWYSVASADDYKVQVSTDPTDFNPPFQVFKQTLMDTTVAIPVGTLEEGTTYYWRVKARDASGGGPYSSTWSFTTLSTTAPATPTQALPSDGADAVPVLPRLYWTSVENADDYKVQVSTDPGNFGPPYQVANAVVTDTSYLVINPLDGEAAYYWRVKARSNANGNSAWSSVWSFTTEEEGFNCPEELPIISSASTADVPTSGQFKALVVFVRYRDDNTTGGCAPSNQEWLDPDVLPTVANYVLSPTPTPPFVDSSLTAFYYEQSGGRFTLYGDVYPQVVVSGEDEIFYNIGRASSPDTEVGMAILTEEVLNEIDMAGWDFSQYDENGDGYIDHIFMVLRRTTLPTGWSGFSILGQNTQPVLTYDGLDVDWDLSGSYNRYSERGNIFPGVNHIRVLAHEFGHGLWTRDLLNGHAHIQPVNHPQGVPANGTSQVGYILMAGDGGGVDIRGDHTISAFERDLLNDGWIDCPVLTTDGPVTLTDLYSDNSNNCSAVSIPSRTVYLSNRQQIGVFDDLRTNTCTAPPNDQGLNTTGLLVTHSEGLRFAVIPADNTLDRSNQASVYEGDMYGPTTSVQLTPWTRPNISGFTTYPPNPTMAPGNWQAIDNIRFSGGPNSEMAFDYIADFRQNPTIREDSWIANETSGYTFTGNVTITNSSILNINTTLGFSSLLHVDTGSEILMESGADVTINGAGQMTVLGTLTNNGSIALDGTMSYESNDAIASGSTFEVRSGADVTFQSAMAITLEPGFHARPNSNFHAFTGIPATLARSAEMSTTSEASAEKEAGKVEHAAVMETIQQRAGEAHLHEALHEVAEALPTSFSLSQNYPNPFNPATTIPYALKEDVVVKLKVYNVLGQEIATLVDEIQGAGYKTAVWNGKDTAGTPVPSGTYLYRLVAGDFVGVDTMVLLR